MSVSERDHSYVVAQRLKPGDRVAMLRSQPYYSTQIPSGARGTVISISNAGFRGMEAYVEFRVPGTVATARTSVSCGALRKVED